MAPCRLLVVATVAIFSSACGALHPAGQTNASSAQQGPWQSGVLCNLSHSMQMDSSCSRVKTVLLKKYHDLLASSSPVVTAKAGNVTFLLLPRYLKPKEANIQFAQAFCFSRGGQLAYWTSMGEYSALSKAALKIAADSRSVWHFYMGMVQAPGSKKPQDGWTWIHSGEHATAAFPWAKGEPNEHNGANIQGHTEDCAVIATYHGQNTTNLVDDFPCNYADSSGKYLANGWNPKLSVACRVAPS